MTEQEMKALFSERLQKLLDKYDMKQNDLSVILGVSESAVGKWILQKAMPRMGIIQKLSDHFNVGKSYFLEYDAPQLEAKRDSSNEEADSVFPPQNDTRFIHVSDREETLINKYRVLPEPVKNDVDEYVDFKYQKHKPKDE